jgi:TRAP-type transport system periplasmic protein
MKKTKKIIRIILAISIVLSIIGCERIESREKVQRYELPLATSSPEDTITQIYAEKFAEEVSRLSDGKMEIQVYANSVLGGDRELLESCKDGDIPFVMQNTAAQVSFMPEIAIFDMPSVFSSIDEARSAVDNRDFYNLIQKVYQKEGYKLLGYADQGFRVMSTDKNIKSLKDFKGQKIRTMENSNHIAFWKALGANPTPMTFNEVYIGLQQGTIDAQENPYEVIVSGKIYEQQEYIIQTNHLPHFISLIVSDEFYKSLSKDKQHIIDEASQVAKEYARESADRRIADKIETIGASGTQIRGISKKLQEETRKVAKPVYEVIYKQAGDEIVNAYLNENK